MKKIISFVVILLYLCMFSACGEMETIDGKWVLIKSKNPDGKIMKIDRNVNYESYEISGDTVKYYLNNGIYKDYTLELKMEKIGENQYVIKLNDKFVFSKAKIKGKYLQCTIGDGKSASVFIYEKE